MSRFAKIPLLLFLLGIAGMAFAQPGPITQFCVQGGTGANVSGLKSTNYQQGIVPTCTVTVYLTGTLTKATIYSDALSTPLSNPFTAASPTGTAPGQWIFYAPTGQLYDVVLSGGVAPNVYTHPVTLTGLGSGGGGGGGGGSVLPAPQRQVAGYPLSGTIATVGPGSTLLDFVTPILQSQYQAGQFLSGGGNNGIGNALTAAGANGFVVVDPTYGGTDAIGPATALKQHVVDQRAGGQVDYFFNPNAQTASTWCMASVNNAGVAGNGITSCNNHTATFLGFGNNIGANIVGPGGSESVYNSVTGGEQVFSYIPGIYSNDVKTIMCLADADCNHYEYWYFNGIDTGTSAEGTQPHAAHYIQVQTYAGTLASIIDARHIRTTPIYGSEIGGGWLQGPAIDTGNLLAAEGVTGLNAYKTSNSHTPSTAYAQSLSQCFGTGGTPTAPNDTVNGQSCGFNVQLLGGTNGLTATFTGTTTGGTALTVSGVTGTIHVGDTLVGPNGNGLITIASGSGSSWVLSGAYGAGGATSQPMYTVNLTSGAAGFTNGQEVCIAGQWTQEVTLTSVSAPSGSGAQGISALLRKPMHTGDLIVAGGCQGLRLTSEIQTASSQNVSDPTTIYAGAPDATHYFGFSFDGASQAALPISFTTSGASRDSSGNIAMSIDNGQPFLQIAGAPLTAVTGCTDTTYNFSAQNVAVTSTQVNFPVGSDGFQQRAQFVQPGAGPFTPGTTNNCVITVSGLNGFTVVPVAEVQSVADPAVASVPGAEQAPINGYFAVGPTNGWLPGAVGQQLLQPGGSRIGINNSLEYDQNTPASPSFRSFFGERVTLNGVGATGPGQNPYVYTNNTGCATYQGCGGQWPIVGFDFFTFNGAWGAFLHRPGAMQGSSIIQLDCPLGPSGINCTQPYSYDFAVFNGNNNSGRLSFNPMTFNLNYSQTFSAAAISANNAAATGFTDALNASSAFDFQQGPCTTYHTFGSTSGINTGTGATDVGARTCMIDFGMSSTKALGIWVTSSGGGGNVNAAVFGFGGIQLPPLGGGGVQCLQIDNVGVVTGTGSACGSGGGGGSSVTVNGGSTLSTANFGASPAAGTNGINVTWQTSGTNVSAEIVGDGNAAHCFSGVGTWVACAAGTGISGLTAGFLPLAGSSTTLTANSHCDDGITSAGVVTCSEPFVASTLASVPAGGVGGTLTLPEGTTASGIAGNDICYADSTLHGIKCSYNNGAFVPNVVGPASSTNGHVAIFSGTGGNILADGGAPGTGTVTSIATTGPLGGGTITTTGTLTCTTCVVASSPGVGIAHFAGSTQTVTSSLIVAADITSNTITGTQLASSLALVTPNIGAATGTSLVVTGNIDGTAGTTITTGTTATLNAFLTGYWWNQEATAATAVAYTLPTAAAGLQKCVGNSWNGSAATTGVLTVNASASGQFIIFTDGTLSATGGNVTSGGAAADASCFVGIDSTHWQMNVVRGTWTKH